MATINESIQLLQFVNDNLKPKEKEKKKNGEVFTPIILIDEMLNKLDENYRKQHNSSIFADKSLKWYDPAVGIGNFAIIIYMRLIVGLGDSIPDEEERKTHIIEKMLYMSELNPNNTVVCRRVFCGDKYKLNLYEGDSLKLDVIKEWGIEKFDIIIGNPPFQDANTTKTAQGGHDIYPSFVIVGFKYLNTNGYLTYITPPKWRATDKTRDIKTMFDIFKENNLIFLRIIGFKETKSYFAGISARVDYYILQNTHKYDNTIIIDEKNVKYEINIREMNFIPNYNFINITKILQPNGENGIDVIYSSSAYDKRKPYMNLEKTTEYKYPVRHSHTIKDGEIIYWTNTQDNVGKNKIKMFGVPKVILIKGLHTYPLNDYKGEYGMSNYSFGIPISSKIEGDLIVNAINTEEFSKIIDATKWSSGFTDHNMFKYFKPDFYKSFL